MLRHKLSAAFACGLCCAPSVLSAADNSWTGGGGIDTKWSTGANWSLMVAPTDMDNIFFTGTPSVTTNLDISITPAEIVFQQGAVCYLQGIGILTVGGPNCPILYYGGNALGIWQGSTTLDLGGDLRLSKATGASSGGTAGFATLNGTGNLTVDASIICNLNASAASWTATSITLGGTINCGAANCLPAAAFVAMQNGVLNLNGFSQSIAYISGSGTTNLSGTTLTLTGSPTAMNPYAGKLTGSGNLTISLSSPTDEFELTGTGGSNDYTGTTTVTNGTLTLGVPNALPTTTSLVFNVGGGDAATLNIGAVTPGVSQTIANMTGGANTTVNFSSNINNLTISNASGTFSGLFNGGAPLTINCSAPYILNGSSGSTFSSALNLQGGTLIAGVSGALPTGNQSFIAPYTLTNSAVLNMNGFSNSIGSLNGSSGTTILLSSNSSSGTLTINGSGTFSGVIQNGGSEPGAIAVPAGTLTLAGANTYTGGTSVGTAGIQIYTVGNLGIPSGVPILTFAGISPMLTALGDLDFTAPSSGTGILIQNSVSLFNTNGHSITISCPVMGSSNLTKIGSGTLTITTSATSYLSGTNIQVGTLALSGSGSLPGAVDISSGAIFDISALSAATSIGLLSGAGTVILGANTLEVNISSSSTFSGNLTGTNGSLTKLGASTLTLTGTTSTYSGTTTVSVGTLQAGAAGAFSPNSAFVIGASGILDLNGFSQTLKSLSNASATSGSSVTLSSSTAAGTLTIKNGGSYNGAITDMVGHPGSLVLTGGTLALSGSNTYTGTTTVSVGTLQAGAIDTFSGSSNIIVQSGAILDLNGFSQSVPLVRGGGNVLLGSGGATLTLTGTPTTLLPFSGAIQETGDVTVDLAGGIWRLNGANIYTGITTLTAGTLRAGAKNVFSPNSDFTVNGGVLDLNGFDQTILSLSGSGGTVGLGSLLFRNTLTLTGVYGSYDGQITGRGNLALNGSGAFQVSGANTYNGTTTINSGTLQAMAGNTFSASSDMVVNSGGILDLNGQTNTIPSLSGSGGVTLGNGFLILSGNNSTTYSGSMSGSGGLTRQGTGTTTLTGTSGYMGATTVSGGVLVVNGTLTSSDVTVTSGGTLKGTGTISQTVTVDDGGLISGGNSIGTIHIGTLNLMSNANLALEINPSLTSTVYDVTNNATLTGANLDITVDYGIYPAGTSFTFLTTAVGTVNGMFNPPVFPPQISAATLLYDTHSVELLLTAPIYVTIPTDGLKRNAKAVAEYLNRFNADPTVQPVLLALGNQPLSVRQASLSSISPARNAIASWTAQNVLLGITGTTASKLLQQRYMRGIENNQPAFASMVHFEEQLIAAKDKIPYGKAQTAAKGKDNYAVWAEGLGQFTNQNAIDENPSFHSSTGCGLIGADFYGFKNSQLGAAIGYAQTGIKESDTGHETIQTYLAGIYGTVYKENAYMELGLWGAFDQFYNTRNVFYPGFAAEAKSHYNGWQLAPHLSFGYDNNFCWGTLEPFVSLDAAMLFLPGYSESGAGFLDMVVKASNSWMLQSEIGLSAYQVRRCKPGTLIFRETLSYVNLAPFGLGELSGTAIVDFPPGFTVISLTEVQNMISPGFELFFKCANNGLFVSLIYDGEFTIGKGRYMSNEGIAKIGGFF